MERLRKGILLVEDNADDEVLALRALRVHGLINDIVVARDGAEAIEMLHGARAPKSPEEYPILVLLDLKLPKIDGLEVLRRIRAHGATKLLPVVVLTSSDEGRDLEESYSLGANSYIRKPVDFDQFTAAVGQLKMYWLVLNEPPPVGAEM